MPKQNWNGWERQFHFIHVSTSSKQTQLSTKREHPGSNVSHMEEKEWSRCSRFWLFRGLSNRMVSAHLPGNTDRSGIICLLGGHWQQRRAGHGLLQLAPLGEGTQLKASASGEEERSRRVCDSSFPEGCLKGWYLSYLTRGVVGEQPYFWCLVADEKRVGWFSPADKRSWSATDGHQKEQDITSL